MSKQLLINSTPEETRVALVENGTLAEFYIERASDRGLVGNIYCGKVVRVLPGMQAAFVDIGLAKAGFLHASDFQPGIADLPMIEEDALAQASMASHHSANTEPTTATPDADAARSETDDVAMPPPPPIEDGLARGDQIIVQVAKEPFGSKGCRVTSHISLPGRYLVYLPTTNHLGVSRRIEDETERERLHTIVMAMKPAEAGFIIRTVCVNVSQRELEADMRFLVRLWNDILSRAETASAPSLIHGDMDLILRSVRDSFTAEIDSVVVDRPHDHQRILEFVDSFAPALKSRVELHVDPRPLFDPHGIEPALSRALERRVWLKSGGYIVIDQTEALTTVDVNTGRYVGKTNHEDTVVKTNLEAVHEIVDQLRVRNIGGIIIVDFIDMMDPANRERVMDAFDAALKDDKMRSNILKISELGLVEMTRKRARASLSELLTDTCPTCDGRGRVKSITTIAYDIMRRIRAVAQLAPEAQHLTVHAHPSVAAFLAEEEGPSMDRLEREIGYRITIEPVDDANHTGFDVVAL